jgi:exodeoxyribonuclease-3
MKLISWNVNGLRAAMKKGFMDFFTEENPDVICLQETKMQQTQKTFDFPGYYEFWNDADKKGYSGTLIITKEKPLNVTNGIDGEGYNDEGRIITAEYDQFFLVNVYVPNTKKELARLDYRMTFDDAFRAYLVKLDHIKPVILCGDLNVANEPIDLKNPKANERNAGYTIEERNQFKTLLTSGFTDTFRHLYPDTVKYSWWTYMFNARKNNAGWRIDYFVISDRLVPKVEDSEILNDIFGSDHCPVKLTITL